MKRKTLLILLMAFVMAAAMATVASADRPTCEPGSTYPWCDEEPPVTTPTIPEIPEDIIWTCQARNDIGGAIWPLFTYSEGTSTYVTNDGPLLCVDITIPESYWDRTKWTVEWSGSTAKGTVKGLKLVFEEEVHGTVYAEEVFHAESGDWTVFLSNADVKNLVFVAMPHSGDKWIGPVTFTITSSEG